MAAEATAAPTADGGSRTSEAHLEAPPDMRPSSGFGYRPALDGIRALAVVAVLVYHFDNDWLPGGFLGVDAFFVLSGYLITSLLLVEHARTGAIRLAGFWARRFRRLMPPMLVVVAGLAAYIGFWADPEVKLGLRNDALGTLFYVANWHFINTGQSYFDEFADPSPLRHTWSLAIEEQFYLFWPLLVLALLWLARKRAWALGVVAMAGTAGSVVAIAVLRTPDASRAYYGTDARIHELLVGALLAILIQRGLLRAGGPVDRWPRAWRIFGVLSLAAVLAAFVVATDETPRYYLGGSLIFALAVAALIAGLERADGGAARVLSLRPVVWVGAISYGLYLYHWPVLTLINEQVLPFRGLLLDGAQALIILAISAASYYWLEKPIRSGKPLGIALPPRRVLIAAPLAMAVTGGLVLWGARGAEAPVWAEGETGEIVALGSSDPDAPTYAIVGDSIARSMLPGLDRAGEEEGVRIIAGAWSGCGTAGLFQLDEDAATPFEFSQSCADAVPERYLDLVREYDPDLVLVHSVRERFPMRTADGVLRWGTPAHEQAVVAGLVDSIDALASEGATVVMSHVVHRAQRFKGTCRDPENAERCAADDGSDGIYDGMNDLIDRAAAKRPGTVILRLEDIVCPGGPPCPTKLEGVHLRWDGSHLTAPGTQWLAPRLLDALDDIRAGR